MHYRDMYPYYVGTYVEYVLCRRFCTNLCTDSGSKCADAKLYSVILQLVSMRQNVGDSDSGGRLEYPGSIAT